MSFKPDQYIKRHIWSGLKVGDKVWVLRTALSLEGGWDNSWESPAMDEMVGKISTIDYDHLERGFHLDDGFSYPCFVLQKVESGKEAEHNGR